MCTLQTENSTLSAALSLNTINSKSQEYSFFIVHNVLVTIDWILPVMSFLHAPVLFELH